MKFRLVILLLYVPLGKCTLLPLLLKELLDNYGPFTRLTDFSCKRQSTYFSAKLLTTHFHPYQAENIDIKAIPYPVPANNVVFLVDLSCRNSKTLLKTASEQRLFSAPYKWILYQSFENITKYLQNLSIFPDSDVTLVKKSQDQFLLTKIFRRRQHLPHVVEEIGKWTNISGLEINYNKITASRRKDLMGIMLNNCIVITHNDSLNHLTDKRDKHIDSIAKVNYVLVEHLSDIMNVSLNYSIQDTWGYYDNLTGWSGMIGELTRNEADIGGTALFLTVDRIEIIDYLSMTTPTRSKFVFRQPKLSYVTNVFVLPFHKTVWISTICLGVVIALNLFIAVKWEWEKLNISEETRLELHGLQNSFFDVVLLTFGAFCQQGATLIPISLPGRIITLFLFVSFMFLYTSYAANIVALLQSSSNNIQTLEDLLKSRLQIGVDDTVFNHFYFTTATEPIHRAIYLQKVAPPGKAPNFMTIEEGVRRMREGLFAFHMETGPGYKLVSETFQEDEKCGLHEIQYLEVPDPWLAVQKNSSYKEIIKIGLRIIQESGLQYREVIQIYTKKPACLSRGSSFISVGLVDCYPAAVVLAGGIILSAGVCLIEIYVHYRVNKCKNKRALAGQIIVTNSKEALDIKSPFQFVN